MSSHLVPTQIVDRNGVVTTRHVRADRLAASLGATPYTGVGRAGADISLRDPYYDSPRYADFDRTVYDAADALDVDVDEVERALGLWEGQSEPSSAIDVTGSRESVEELARTLAERFQQYAVRVIYRPGSGADEMSVFTIPPDDDPAEVVEMLRLAGLSGARVVDGELQLADAEPLPPAAAAVLERRYGPRRIEQCEVVRVGAAGRL